MGRCGADGFVAEGAVGDELDFEGEVIVLGDIIVDGETHGKVESGVGAAVVDEFGLGILIVVVGRCVSPRMEMTA